MAKRMGMGRLGPKRSHISGAFGPGHGRKGLTAKHTTKQPGRFGYGGRKKR